MASLPVLAFNVLLVLTAFAGNCHGQTSIPINIPNQGSSMENSNEQLFDVAVFPWLTKRLPVDPVTEASVAKHEYILQLPISSKTLIELLLRMDPSLSYKLLSLFRKHEQQLEDDFLNDSQLL